MPGADETHQVPSGLLENSRNRKENGRVKIATFHFEQETERGASFCEERFISNPRIIERKTGLNFFHALTRTEQNKLETGPGNLLQDLGCTP